MENGESTPSPQRLALRLRRRTRNGHAPEAGLHPHGHRSHAVTEAGHETHTQLETLKEQLARTHAEFDNFRKRQRREGDQQREQAGRAVVEALLPVLDNFDRALINPGDSVDALVSGVEMIHRQLQDVLAQNGLERVEALGQPFDPTLHEAVTTGEAEDGVEDNQVIEVFQPGYKLKGRLLRPSMVKVARK